MLDAITRYLPENDPRSVALQEVFALAAGMTAHPSGVRYLSQDPHEAFHALLGRIEEDIKSLRAHHDSHPWVIDGDLIAFHAIQLAAVLKLQRAGSEERLREHGIWPGDE